MNIFDVVESDLREQIVVLESDNKVLKSEIIRLEKELREERDLRKNLEKECEQLIDNIEEICFETNIDSSDFLPERKDDD